MRRIISLLLVALFLVSACGEARRDQKKRHFLHKGNLSYKEKMYTDAMRYYREAIGIDSSFAQAWNNLGIVYQKMGRSSEAINAFSVAILADTGFYEAYYNRGNARYERREFSASITDYDEAFGRYGTMSELLFAKGASFFGMHRYDSAAASFEYVIKDEPDNIEAYLNLGSAKLFLRQPDEALALGKKAFSMDSTSADALNLLGMVYLSRENYAAALQHFENGLHLAPNNPFLHNNLGFVRLMTGDMAQAEKNINESIAIDPENPWAYRNKGIWYLKAGATTDAIRLLEQCIAMDAQLPLAHYYLGMALLENSKLSEACEAWTTSMALNEKEGELAYRQHCEY